MILVDQTKNSAGQIISKFIELNKSQKWVYLMSHLTLYHLVTFTCSYPSSTGHGHDALAVNLKPGRAADDAPGRLHWKDVEPT
jgi:hypothetical protein